MKRILIITFVVIQLAAATLVVIMSPGLRSATTLTWTASSGQPTPDRFLYAMFPASDDTLLAQMMPTRIVLNAHAEVHNDQGTYRIHDASGTEHRVPKSALTFEPPASDLDLYLEALNTTIAAWGTETDFRSASLIVEQTDGGVTVTLTTINKNGSEGQFEYTVRSGIATPTRSIIRR